MPPRPRLLGQGDIECRIVTLLREFFHRRNIAIPLSYPAAISAVGRAGALVHQEMRTQLLASAYDQYDPLVKGFKTIATDFEHGNCKKL
jgi:hypothetical protein